MLIRVHNEVRNRLKWLPGGDLRLSNFDGQIQKEVRTVKCDSHKTLCLGTNRAARSAPERGPVLGSGIHRDLAILHLVFCANDAIELAARYPRGQFHSLGLLGGF
jgi:hypothetical protein